MRTAAIAIACILAGTAGSHAEELAPTPGAPLVTSSAKLHIQPATSTAAPYPSDQPRVQRVVGESGQPPRGRICFTQAETRDKIAAHRLFDPVRALRMGGTEGDALSAKLCRWRPDEFVYELHVLRRDGRVLHVFMNAQSGEALRGQSASGRDKDRN